MENKRLNKVEILISIVIILFFRLGVSHAVETITLSPTKGFIVYDVDMENPTAAPIDDDANAGNNYTGNEFTFDNASPGILRVRCKAKIKPDTAELKNYLNDKIRWTISDRVGTWSWNSPWPGTPTSGRGHGIDSDLVGQVIGLPAANDDFGQKTVTMEVIIDGTAVITRTRNIEVFYSKNADNHPGGQAGSPNWYYYWLQVIGGATPTRYDSGGGIVYGGVLVAEIAGMLEWEYGVLHDKDTIVIYDPAAGVDPGDPFSPHGQVRTTGIDCFEDIYSHESRHVSQIDDADPIVGIVAGTCWRFGWSWNQGPDHNHWNTGADGLPGVPRFDDDGDGTVDNLIVSGPGELGYTSDDAQVINAGQGQPNTVIITAGANGALETAPSGDDTIVGNTIVSGPDGIANTTVAVDSDDVQVIPVGQGQPNMVIIIAGANGALETAPSGDDTIVGNTITSGPNGIANTKVAVGDDDLLEAIDDWPKAWGAPPPGPWAQGNAIEHQAYGDEPDQENRRARKDWGNPGKNHRTNDVYND